MDRTAGIAALLAARLIAKEQEATEDAEATEELGSLWLLSSGLFENSGNCAGNLNLVGWPCGGDLFSTGAFLYFCI